MPLFSQWHLLVVLLLVSDVCTLSWKTSFFLVRVRVYIPMYLLPVSFGYLLTFFTVEYLFLVTRFWMLLLTSRKLGNTCFNQMTAVSLSVSSRLNQTIAVCLFSTQPSDRYLSLLESTRRPLSVCLSVSYDSCRKVCQLMVLHGCLSQSAGDDVWLWCFYFSVTAFSSSSSTSVVCMCENKWINRSIKNSLISNNK